MGGRRPTHPWSLVFAAVVAFLTVIAFLPIFDNGFVEWDDGPNLLRNEAYRGLGRAQLSWMFVAFHAGHYLPLTWLTFGFDYLVWGMDPVGYHLTNLLLHTANAVLFFLIAVRLLALANPVLGAEWLGLRVAALTAALLFSLHPLRVESVAWATERRDVLCGFFYLLAILAYLHACDAPAAAPRARRLWYGAAVAAGAAALLSKSMAVSLPLVLLVLDVYPLRRLTLDRRIVAEAEQRRALAEKIPFVVLSAAAIPLAIFAARHGDSLTSMSQVGIGGRLSLADFSLAFYLWKMLVPLNLAALYERPVSVDWSAPAFVFCGLVVLSLTAVAVGLRGRWPALAAVWATYVVILIPVSGIVHNGPQIAADRYTYLSCLGWGLLAAGGLGAGWLHLRRTRPAASAAWRLVPVVLIVSACLGALTWRQTEVWHDTESLWTHAVAVSPSAVAYYNLGAALAAEGRTAEAIERYRDAVKRLPTYVDAHNNLGFALAQESRLEEAAQHLREAVKLRPAWALAHYNLAFVLDRQGRTAEALEHLREASRLRPEAAAILNNMGATLVKLGRLDEAAAEYREALRLDPRLQEAQVGLDRVLAHIGRPIPSPR